MLQQWGSIAAPPRRCCNNEAPLRHRRSSRRPSLTWICLSDVLSSDRYSFEQVKWLDKEETMVVPHQLIFSRGRGTELSETARKSARSTRWCRILRSQSGTHLNQRDFACISRADCYRIVIRNLFPHDKPLVSLKQRAIRSSRLESPLLLSLSKQMSSLWMAHTLSQVPL